MADIKILNPDALGKPLGQYSHLTRVKASEFVFIAGQVGVSKPADALIRVVDHHPVVHRRQSLGCDRFDLRSHYRLCFRQRCG